MKSYWYVPPTHKYLQSNRLTDSMRVVMFAQVKKNASIVEMTGEATLKETDSCKLVHCGHGSWKDRHILENVEKCIS